MIVTAHLAPARCRTCGKKPHYVVVDELANDAAGMVRFYCTADLPPGASPPTSGWWGSREPGRPAAARA